MHSHTLLQVILYFYGAYAIEVVEVHLVSFLSRPNESTNSLR